LQDEKERYFYYYHLGNALYLINDFEPAVKAYYQSWYELKLLNSESKITFLGNVLLKLAATLAFSQKKYLPAMLVTNKLLELYPFFPDALYLQAYCEMNLGNRQKAGFIFRQILNLTDYEKRNPYNFITLTKESLFSMVKN